MSSSHRSTETLSQNSPSNDRDVLREHEGHGDNLIEQRSGAEDVSSRVPNAGVEESHADNEAGREVSVREKDVVELGLISDEDARELYRM